MQQSEHHDLGAFKLLQSFDIEYAPVKVSKWRSENTGLTVVVGSHKNPIVRAQRPHLAEKLISSSDKRILHRRVRESVKAKA